MPQILRTMTSFEAIIITSIKLLRIWRATMS
jgi:hypothetical protein